MTTLVFAACGGRSGLLGPHERTDASTLDASVEPADASVEEAAAARDADASDAAEELEPPPDCPVVAEASAFGPIAPGFGILCSGPCTSCGDGVIVEGGACPEECDDAVPVTASCEDLGWGAGKPGCWHRRFDVTGCGGGCTTDPRIVACRPTRFAPQAIDLAAGSDAVWIKANQTLAQLPPDLVLKDKCCGSAAYGVAVATIPGGAFGSLGSELGVHVGASRVPGARYPLLAGRDGGLPLFDVRDAGGWCRVGVREGSVVG